MASYMGHEYTPAPTQVVQGRYRVGDRVRVVKDGGGEGGSGHGAAVGSVLEVEEENDCGVLAGGWFLWWGEFAPAFLPGDKVRVTRCNGYFAAGDEGVVEKQGKYNVFVKHGPYQRVGLPIEAEKLELVESAGDDQPKFKAGDVVRSRKWRGDGHTIACVKAEYENGKPFTGRTAYDYTYGAGWDYEEDIELVTADPCPQDNEQHETTLGDILEAALTKRGIVHQRGSEDSCIVALTKNGQPRPADRPYVHASVAAATQEAERLARNNPGQEFAVYQRVAGRVCETTYNMREVA